MISVDLSGCEEVVAVSLLFLSKESHLNEVYGNGPEMFLISGEAEGLGEAEAYVA